MSRYRSLVLVLLVGFPAASAAGCGGDEETAPAPTRQEFVAQADAICRSAEQDLTAQSRDLGFYVPDGLDEEEAEFIEQEVIPFYQGQIDEIRELTPPTGDEERIEEALSAAERGLAADLREDPDRVPKGWMELARVLRGYGSGPCGN